MSRRITRFFLDHLGTIMYLAMFATIVLALGWFIRNTSTATTNPAAKSVVMTQRNADVTILSNGDVEVVETWQTQFNGGPFRTASRTIPLNRLSDIKNFSVSENEKDFALAASNNPGNPNTYSVSQDSKGYTFRWFFAETNNAPRKFTLRYTMTGAVRIYPGGDQLYWKFIEANRGYPILSARVTLHLPGNFSADQIKLATYLSDGKATRLNDRTVAFEGGPFAAQTEWEVRAQFPHGIVTASAPAWQASADAEDAEADQLAAINLFQLWGGIVILLGGLLGVLVWYYVRLPKPTTRLGVSYLTEPPGDLTPGLAGTLLDGTSSPKNVVATLVDFAQRGLLTMQEHGRDHIFRYVRSDERHMRFYEVELMRILFGDGRQRKLSDLRARFSNVEHRIESAMNKELVQTGYFNKIKNQLQPWWISVLSAIGKIISLPLLMFYMSAAFFLFVAYVENESAFDWGSQTPLLVFDATVIVIIINAIIWVQAQRPIQTSKGAEAIIQWQAFKRYLENIRRYTEVAQAQQQFEKYLPYAIAFGVESNWLNAFQSVETPAPDWYRTKDEDDRSERRASASHSTGASASNSNRPTPSLDRMAGDTFRGLNSMSASFIGMLNSTADAIASKRSWSSDSGSSSSGGSRSGGSSSGSSSSSSSGGWSGGSSRGGGGSGGGSSGFG